MITALYEDSPDIDMGAAFRPLSGSQYNWNNYMKACCWGLTVWYIHSITLPWEWHSSQDSERTARATTIGIAVTQQALTSSCEAFTTAGSPSCGLSTTIFCPSPVSSTWTANASIGKIRGRHCILGPSSERRKHLPWTGTRPASKVCTKT